MAQKTAAHHQVKEEGGAEPDEAQCSVALYLALKTASFRPVRCCKSARYLRVSPWFAPGPEQKSIGFKCAIKNATVH